MKFEQDAENIKKELTKDTIAALKLLAKKQLEKEEEVEDLDQKLKDAKKALDEIQLYKIPDLMQEAGVNSVEFVNHKIEVKNELKVGITKTNKPAAHAWLRKNEHGDIIKNEIKVRIPVGADENADAIIEFVEDLELDAERSETVHSATLKSFCKEMREKGEDLPDDLLGIFEFRKSTIKPLKK